MPDMDSFTDEFVAEWVGKHLNINGAHINFDGRYGTQCMDLWNYWWTELGLTGITRNPDAASVWENVNGTYYDHFDGILPDRPARKGDVFIYNRKAWGTGYGHIGIVLKDNSDGTITVFETNGLGDGYEDIYMNQYGSPPRIHTWPKKNLYGYLRYIGENEMASDQWYKDMIDAQARIDRKVDEIHARVFGKDVQRYYDPATNEVSDVVFEGGIPARSTDVHDVISTNNLIVEQNKLLIEALKKPKVTEAK